MPSLPLFLLSTLPIALGKFEHNVIGPERLVGLAGTLIAGLFQKGQYTGDHKKQGTQTTEAKAVGKQYRLTQD